MSLLYLRPPRKVFIAFPYFDLTGLTALFHRAPVRDQDNYLGAVFLPVWAFLDGVSRRQGYAQRRRQRYKHGLDLR
jgi:hypothetical protein